MKSFVLASLLASAAAFAPASQQRASTSLNEFCNGYVGGDSVEPMFIGETGSKNFDPAGFTTGAPEWVPWFRESELKHGRAAMLGVLGFVVPEFIRVPGEQFSFSAIPKVIDAHDALPDSMIQIFGWISFLEAVQFPALANMNEFDRAPGDFGFDPLGLKPKDEAGYKAMQLKELKNGRLAMIALGGMVAQSVVTGHGFPYI
eukprot:scaffold2782_cov182-Amphora_coffeaeformis.AAC.21